MSDRIDSANIRFPPPLIYVGALAIGIWAGRALGVPRLWPNSVAREVLGAILLLGGIAIAVAGAGLFRRLGTAVIPHKPAARLVTSGIYRWTRNPMYLGMTLVYAGVATLFDSILALALLAPVVLIIQTQVIAREEAYLERAFGGEYRAYKARVRRWI